MRVLLTGAHGYIGAVTYSTLVAAGHDVTGADVFLFDGCDLHGVTAPTAEIVRLDVRDVVPSDLEGFDAVVHLAALSNDPLGDLRRELTFEINLEGSLRIARAAKEAGVRRFVFASSCSMYGAASTDAVDETAPLSPLTAYAESKVRAEEALVSLADDGFSPVFMRNATAYGVSPRLRLDIVLNNLAAWSFTTGRIRILSDGTPWRPIVHIRDIARATVAILEAPRAAVHAEAFNIGADTENYQVRDLAEIVRSASNGVSVEYGESGDPDPRSYRVDFGKFRSTFPDFTCEWNAASGARELLDAYARAELTFADFEGERFTRLKHVQALIDSSRVDDNLRSLEVA
jgi:nucleoside-diphosphate-sugar epimerase